MSDYYGPVGGGGNSDNARSQQPQQYHQKSYHNKSYNNDLSKIFVGGLSWQTTEESLRFHFEQFGPVAHVDVMKDRVTGDPRGFAFVVFRDPATIDLVMNEGKHEINHKIVDVKRAQARGQAPPSIHGGDKDPNNTSNNTSNRANNSSVRNRIFNTVKNIAGNCNRFLLYT